MMEDGRKFLILHIPKTGLTSLTAELARKFGPNHVVVNNRDREFPFLADNNASVKYPRLGAIKNKVRNLMFKTEAGKRVFGNLKRDYYQIPRYSGDYSDISAVIGHFGEGVQEFYRGKFFNPITMVVLREPWQQVQSLYKWITFRHAYGLAPAGYVDKMEFSDFLKLPSVRNYQSDYIKPYHLDQYDGVLTTGNLDKTAPAFFRNFHVEGIDVPHLNISSNNPLQYTDDDKERFWRESADIPLFEEARRMEGGRFPEIMAEYQEARVTRNPEFRR